jgi:hypothetical protein
MIKDVSGGPRKVQAIQHIDVYFFKKKKVKKEKRNIFPLPGLVHTCSMHI